MEQMSPTDPAIRMKEQNQREKVKVSTKKVTKDTNPLTTLSLLQFA